MSEKLTPWFPASVKPARKGIYISSVNSATFYRLWDGENWYYGGNTIQEADERRPRPKWPFPEFLRWRGLASDPAADADAAIKRAISQGYGGGDA